MQIDHLNFGWLHKPPLPTASCHCLVVQANSGVVLIDTGIGMHDVANPEQRIGAEAIDAAGLKFSPNVTAIQQLRSRGIDASRVTDIVLTHCDSDHVGGRSDFPNSDVHVSSEEKSNLDSGNPRYTPREFGHGPKWQTYSENDSNHHSSDLHGLLLHSHIWQSCDKQPANLHGRAPSP
ncbi:MBL fold metallo-hydrolase [Roseiconus lacunae]|uniref:MBL fold metallo-hydrolase n=1 Tax=Roseiconus lacunae TaxID=2605694 RepID=UPI0011F3E8B5|nr:MBL fold metallo-hydrolase [Roseiconus lacunae]